MNLFKYLYGLFFKSDDDENNKINGLTKIIKHEDCLAPNIIDALLKKYNCQDQEDLVIILQEKEFRNEEFTDDEKIFFNNPEWELLKSFAELGFTLHREHQFDRSIAIRELIENRYQIQLDEHENPFKELINFTLNYFDRYFVKDPIEAEKLLINSFPSMHLYIKRKIIGGYKEATNNYPLNEQNSYDEFLFFCKSSFCLLYPDKSIRDEQIKHHFKIFHHDLIQFIDAEQTT